MNIKDNADKLLYEYGLMKILEQHGKVQLIGSYYMDIMAPNDLDIYVDNEEISAEAMYQIINDIIKIFRPVWFEVKHNFNDNFIGFETKILADLWNVDIRFISKDDIQKTVDYNNKIIEKLEVNKLLKQVIIDIKKELIKRNEYGFGMPYNSLMVYDSILNNNIKSIEDFINLSKREE